LRVGEKKRSSRCEPQDRQAAEPRERGKSAKLRSRPYSETPVRRGRKRITRDLALKKEKAGRARKKKKKKKKKKNKKILFGEGFPPRGQKGCSWKENNVRGRKAGVSVPRKKKEISSRK